MKKLLLPLALAAALAAPGIASADAGAAKSNGCMKCHDTDKKKDGPGFKEVAKKYKGKADAEEKTIKKMTTTFKVKLSDGSEEDHKVVNTKDAAAIKNCIKRMPPRRSMRRSTRTNCAWARTSPSHSPRMARCDHAGRAA